MKRSLPADAVAVIITTGKIKSPTLSGFFVLFFKRGKPMPYGIGGAFNFSWWARKVTKEAQIRGRDFDFPSPYLSLSFETTKENSPFSLESLSYCGNLRGSGGISDEAQAEARSPRVSFFSGVPGFFLHGRKKWGTKTLSVTRQKMNIVPLSSRKKEMGYMRPFLHLQEKETAPLFSFQNLLYNICRRKTLLKGTGYETY